MPRILHVNKFAHVVGGVETHIRLLMDGQSSAGNEVELFSASDVPGLGFDATSSGIRGRLSSVATLFWSRAAEQALTARIVATRPDVVHFHGIYHQLSPSVLTSPSVTGATTVLTLHDYKLAAPCYLLFRNGHECTECVGRTLPIPAVRHRCVKHTIVASVTCAVEQAVHKPVYRGRVDAYVVPSATAGAYLSRSGSIDPQRLHVVPHGVIVPPEPSPLLDSPPRVVYFGRLAPEKGVRPLLRAWIQAALPAPWELVIAGDGSERTELERSAVPSVRFIGHLDQPELQELLHTASFVVVPSLFPETFGLSAAEAMASGIPVLVARTGNLPSLVGNSQQVFSAGDSAHWAEALRWIASSRELRLELGRAGRERIRECFDPQASVRRLDGVYAAASAARHASAP